MQFAHKGMFVEAEWLVLHGAVWLIRKDFIMEMKGEHHLHSLRLSKGYRESRVLICMNEGMNDRKKYTFGRGFIFFWAVAQRARVTIRKQERSAVTCFVHPFFTAML